MDAVTLARFQFGMTSIYHFLFVPLSIGLSLMVAIMETRYVRSNNILYKKMAQFWGRLFLINASVGIVTGIVQEFQFGMNWSEYSRFVGDVFGAPLAIETLIAFFLESTFLGIWIFGWEKLNKYIHLACIWLVVFGSLMSAFWIIVANSFMQHPVGYTLNNGRAEMADFGAMLSNPYVWAQFPHVLMGGAVTGAFFVLGVSAYNILKKKGEVELFRRSAHLAVVIAVIASLGAAVAGDLQGKTTAKYNPMKIAAAEALWETKAPAPWSLVSIIDEQNHKNTFSIEIPAVLSFLSYGDFSAEVRGLNDLQAEYEQKYGPGNYIPNVTLTYWAFRSMAGSGAMMVLVSTVGLFFAIRRKLIENKWLLRIMVAAIALPYVANMSGWLLAETGRQPWVVNGLLKTEAAVSPNVSIPMMIASLAIFATLYLALIVADVMLMAKFAKGDAMYMMQHTTSGYEADEDKMLIEAY